MQQLTKAIVLKSVKYGETSLVVTLFTQLWGVHSYMVQGVRTSKGGRNKAAFYQPGTLLEIEASLHPQKKLQRIREAHFSYLYQTMHEDVVKNSVTLFCVELLLRMLQEGAPLEELFAYSYSFFQTLDVLPGREIANFPLYFICQLGRHLGYDLKGSYTKETPYLDLQEGGFSNEVPRVKPFVSPGEAFLLSEIRKQQSLLTLKSVQMSAATRFELLEWYLAFLQAHSQHLGTIKSLPVLRAVLH